MWHEPPTFFIRDLLPAVGSPVTFVALAVISVDIIYTLAIDTRIWTALVNIDVTVRTWKSGLAFTVIKSLARLAVKEMRAVSCAHVQSCKKKNVEKTCYKARAKKRKEKKNNVSMYVVLLQRKTTVSTAFSYHKIVLVISQAHLENSKNTLCIYLQA